MKITAHFSLSELTITATGLQNIPEAKHMVNLTKLAHTLEQVRVACGNRAVIISSAFRSLAVNKKVGGSDTSAHLRGDAADLTVSGLTIAEVCKIIRESGIEFDQLIEEYHNGSEWVHLGLSSNPRNEYLIFKNGAYKRGEDYASYF